MSEKTSPGETRYLALERSPRSGIMRPVGAGSVPDLVVEGQPDRVEPPVEADPAEAQHRFDVAVAIDEATSAWRRFSPFKSRWPEVVEFDRRIRELDERRTTIVDELQALQDRHRESVEADKLELATWMADNQGERPQATAPRVAEHIRELQANLDALQLAVARVLAEKEQFVTRHRGRLAKDAEAATRQQLGRVQQLVSDLEQAREELAGLRSAELWAALYPAEQATNPLSHQQILCGRRQRILPELVGSASADKVFMLLRADANVLASAASEGQRALLEGRDSRADPLTGWSKDEDYVARQRAEGERLMQHERTGTRWEE